MPSADAVQRRLDTRFDQAQTQLDQIAMNADGYSLDDMHSFVAAMRQMSTASYAVNQETAIKHNLAKAIVDAMP
ncbi:serine kinase [Pseudomonas borbori]